MNGNTVQVEEKINAAEQFEQSDSELQYKEGYYIGVVNTADESEKQSRRCFNCAKDQGTVHLNNNRGIRAKGGHILQQRTVMHPPTLVRHDSTVNASHISPSPH